MGYSYNNYCFRRALVLICVSAWVSISYNLERIVTSPSTTEMVDRSFFVDMPLLSQRANYWVLYNHIKRRKLFGYNDSVTYATHGEFTYLENVVQLAVGWQGPISVSVYCPGTDYQQTLLRIQYLRECFPNVKDLVTFHLFFDHEEVPTQFSPTPWKDWESTTVSCGSQNVFKNNLVTYRDQHKLVYPINIARNIAREMSPTYYVLMADIELYTSPPNLIPDFLEMIRKNKVLQQSTKQVFVLPVFEVEKHIKTLPNNKTELQALLRKNLAIPFHNYTCRACHTIPGYEMWVKEPVSTGLHVFHTAKRSKEYKIWEPFYIGTNHDPVFDERFPREGEFNKMLQGMTMCLLDYDFHILDNAFLVHRPGIKKKKRYTSEMKEQRDKNRNLAKQIFSTEMKLLFGKKPECGNY